MTATPVDFQHLARQDALDAHLYDSRDPGWMTEWFAKQDATTATGLHSCPLCFTETDDPGLCDSCGSIVDPVVGMYE